MNMIRAVFPKLMKGLKTGGEEIKEEVLEILTEIFKNFNQLLVKQNNLVNKEDVLQQLCELLLFQGKGVRKKATNCLGQFAIVLTQRQLQKLITILLDRLNKSDNKVDLLTQIQCISQITRCVGGKLGQNYETLFSKLIQYPTTLQDDISEDIDNELAEASLLSIENMIRKCPDQAIPSLKSIFKLTSEAITYDPNYNYQEDDDGGMGNDEDMDDQDGWGDEYDGEDEQIDADDTAWKVRKSAIKVIDAVVISCPAYLKDYWISYFQLLQGRFIERDDNVKCDILQTFQNLIKMSVVLNQDSMDQQKSSGPLLSKANSQGPALTMQKQKSFMADIEGHYDVIVKTLLKQYQTKNIKVKIAVIKTFSVVALMMQNELEKYLSQIVPIIFQSLSDNNNDILTYALNILQQGFKNTDPMMASQVA